MEASKLLPRILDDYRAELGSDFDRYHHHAQRVLATCLRLDPRPARAHAYALAAAFHDIGIWTAGSFDYLALSADLAEAYMQAQGYSAFIEEVRAMILWHHQIRSYRGVYVESVQVFRKADWMDVSLGLRRFGLPRAFYRKVCEDYPRKGFHAFLLRQTWRQFRKQPWRPLPMVKW